MGKQDFKFELYRLNIVDDQNPTLDLIGKPLRLNGDLIAVLQESTKPKYDESNETGTSSSKWSLRRYSELDNQGITSQPIVTMVLARSIASRESTIVTDSDIVDGTSVFFPAPAEAINIVFYLTRHYVAVEFNSSIFSSNAWREAIEFILRKAAFALGYSSEIRLEPQPKKEEILQAFHSFTKLTRLHIVLRLPNPDLTRYTEKLYAELSEGGIREYKQDMRNPNGLSQIEGKLPHASAAMAQDGYKKGDVILEGIRNGRKTRVTTGRKAARGEIQQLKEYVRGILTNAKSKEGRTIASAIINEINAITERPISDQ